MMIVEGSAKGRTAIIVDDIADTCGTLCFAAVTLVKSGGAVRVYAVVTHGVFSGDAVERIESSPFIEAVAVTNTVPQVGRQSSNKIAVVDVAQILADAMKEAIKA